MSGKKHHHLCRIKSVASLLEIENSLILIRRNFLASLFSLVFIGSRLITTGATSYRQMAQSIHAVLGDPGHLLNSPCAQRLVLETASVSLCQT